MSHNKAGVPVGQVLTDEHIDQLARPFAGMGGVEDYRAFARAVLASAEAPTKSDIPSTAGAANIKRYDGFCSYEGGGPADMEESADGQYVKFSDIEHLLAAPVAQSTADAGKVEEIRSLLEEAAGFAAVSPRGKENINAALDLLDDLAAPALNPSEPSAGVAAAWALKQIADLDPKNGSIATAVFMAREGLATSTGEADTTANINKDS